MLRSPGEVCVALGLIFLVGGVLTDAQSFFGAAAILGIAGVIALIFLERRDDR